MKKIIAGILVLVMLTALFAGCANSGEKSGVTTVTVWTGNSHSKEVYQRLVDKFNNGEGKTKGIYIDYQVKEGDTMAQSVELALQNGDAPDMFASGSVIKFAENDYIAAIDDLPGGKEFIAKYDGVLREDVNSYKGKTYTVPISATPQGLVYNKELFKQAGLVDENGEAKAPETFEELREYAKKLTDTSKKQYGIILPLKWGGWFGSDINGPMQSSVGHQGFNPVTGEYDYTGLVPIMEAFLGMRDDGSVFPGASGLDNDTARATFASGKIGMKFAFSFDVGVFNDQFLADFDWGVAPYPVVDKENAYKQRMTFTYSSYINKKSLETVGGDKLMTVLKFFTGDDTLRQAYIEGVDLPYDARITEGVELTEAKRGWKEFGDLLEVSARIAADPNTDLASEKSIAERFLNEVWNGGSKTPIEICEEYNKVMTEARDRYAQNNEGYDWKKYIDPAWDIKR